jgi:hypothetical protein
VNRSLHAAIWRILADELVEDVVIDGCHLRLVGHARGHLLVVDRCEHDACAAHPQPEMSPRDA